MLESRPRGRFGMLLDPHTGIPLPDESFGRASASHAPLSFVLQVNEELRPTYMICFDQNHHRKHRLTKVEQRSLNRESLRKRGIVSFYYVSRAPFLFLASQVEVLEAMRERLGELGIPRNRLSRRTITCLVRRELCSPGTGNEHFRDFDNVAPI